MHSIQKKLEEVRGSEKLKGRKLFRFIVKPQIKRHLKKKHFILSLVTRGYSHCLSKISYLNVKLEKYALAAGSQIN